MSWFKVDDKFHSHPKIKRIPRRLRRAAIGLWTIAGSWSADYETDGAVPDFMLEEFDADPEEVDALVDVELWERNDDGIAFCNWAEFQPTRAQLDEKRSQTAERVQKFRQKKRENRTETSMTSTDGNAVTGALVTQVKRSPRTRPVPDPTPTTPPTPLDQGELLAAPEASTRRSRAFVYPDGFEEWWKAYPRKDDKRKALTAWQRVVREVPNEDLIIAAKRYRDDPNRAEAYTKLATSWLNGGAWENGPLPPRGGPGGGRPDNLSQSLSVVAQLRAEREAEQLTHTTRPTLTARRTA